MIEDIILSPAPTVTGVRPYTEEHLVAIEKVFGESGLNIARARTCQISIGNTPSQTQINDQGEVITIMHHKQWLHSVPSVIHEFAHTWVCLMFPDAARRAPQTHHEACAILAELILMQRTDRYKKEIMNRFKAIKDNPLDMYRIGLYIMNKHLGLHPMADVHGMMGYIINDREHYRTEKTHKVHELPGANEMG